MKKIIIMLLFLFMSKGVMAVNVDSYLVPATKSIAVGEVFTAKLMVNSGSNKVSSVKMRVQTDVTKLKIKSVMANGGVFNSVLMESVSGNIATIYAMASKPGANLPNGEIEVATIIFEGVANSNSGATMLNDYELVGPGLVGTLFWQNPSYTVGTVVNEIDLILNYKVVFGGVIAANSQCAINWPLKIMVSGNGQSKTYENIVPTNKKVVGNKLVFSGNLALTGFTQTSGVAAFISGSKHLSSKYGKNNQTDLYDIAGGELTLTKTNSPVYDFSDYPLLAGDINNDAMINGVDFASVKAKSLIHESTDLRGDLDGNCQVNSNDVNILKMSLQSKQGQTY